MANKLKDIKEELDNKLSEDFKRRMAEAGDDEMDLSESDLAELGNLDLSERVTEIVDKLRKSNCRSRKALLLKGLSSNKFTSLFVAMRLPGHPDYETTINTYVNFKSRKQYFDKYFDKHLRLKSDKNTYVHDWAFQLVENDGSVKMMRNGDDVAEALNPLKGNVSIN